MQTFYKGPLVWGPSQLAGQVNNGRLRISPFLAALVLITS